ncbi:MBL fold metallo-hydrolase RNA specificity domain-containing protein [Castellaniella sp.]|uniref:MBL fold metallo-hydrolase RNA specificity domain-containing protein n=1 Tax=Castellaniella sp. TaxID=1955812 RepID=UPI00355FB9BE
MKLSFLGAAGEVTGSCFLMEAAGVRFLVDCGLFQGGREALTRNHRPFDFAPAGIDFVLLTHAHVDHSGLLPKLVRDGFRGPIHSTAATIDLLGVMLPDSAHIQETDAARNARRFGDRRTRPPLYTLRDAQASLKLTRSIEYDQRFSPAEGIQCRFRDAGHIIGSAIIELWITEYGRTTKLVFSGDLGQPNRPIVRDPAVIDEADLLIMESTYGDRLHPPLAETENEMVEVIQRTLFEQGGNVIIPAFAVGRTQQMLYLLHRLTCDGRLKNLKVFVDSPMATEATHLTYRHLDLFDEPTRELVQWRACAADMPALYFTASVEESMALNQVRSGVIIISASGMCDAGRIRHHLRHNLARPECSVLIPGFQAEGTLGRRLVDGADQVRLFGETIPVRAAIRRIDGLSAHADQAALLNWAAAFKRAPAQTYVVHGEPAAGQALADQLHQRLGWHVMIPTHGQVVS